MGGDGREEFSGCVLCPHTAVSVEVEVHSVNPHRCLNPFRCQIHAGVRAESELTLSFNGRALMLGEGLLWCKCLFRLSSLDYCYEC